MSTKWLKEVQIIYFPSLFISSILIPMPDFEIFSQRSFPKKSWNVASSSNLEDQASFQFPSLSFLYNYKTSSALAAWSAGDNSFPSSHIYLGGTHHLEMPL